jgi:hypothetical protein
MQPFRILLTGLIVAGLALANSPSHAVEWWWFKQKQKYKAIPGGPQVVKLPDLVVDSINPKLSGLVPRQKQLWLHPCLCDHS